MNTEYLPYSEYVRSLDIPDLSDDDISRIEEEVWE